MSRRAVVSLVTGAALAAGAWGVGSAYAEHRDVLQEGSPHDASPARERTVRTARTEPAPAMRTADAVVLRAERERAPRPTPESTPPDAPVLLAPGDVGPAVREIQARLRQIGWFAGDVTDFYGDITRAAVAGFQTKRGLPSTGSFDSVTLERLEGMTSEPTADELANVEPEPPAPEAASLDPRCLSGRVLCVDKSTSTLRWVVDGDVQLTLDARFGGNGYTTREGEYDVYRMSRDHVSSLYDTSMPFAMFFSGGQAVHYSPDFAATGYAGASHGCVNIRDYESIAWLFDQVRIGDKVVVSWT
jgi:peptidoglycan hydrolase-like protein with peptidoglycan-binding domain